MRGGSLLSGGRGAALGALAFCVLAGSGLAGFIAGCGGSVPPPSERVRYVTHRAEKSFGDCAGGGARCTRIKLRWPEVLDAPGPAVKESLAAFIRDALLQPYDEGTLLPNPDSVMARFIGAYRSFVAESLSIPTVPWKFERTIAVLGDTLGVASLAVREWSFLGGAHPNSTTRFTNFDVESGRVLRRSDLLREDARDQLDSLGERVFRRVRRLRPDTDLSAAGFWFKGGRFQLNDNMAVTRTGLRFFFNEYEIGPHALGATELSLPWADVQNFVRRDRPLQRRAGRGAGAAAIRYTPSRSSPPETSCPRASTSPPPSIT